MSTDPKTLRDALRAKDEAELSYKWMRRLTALAFIGWLGLLVGFAFFAVAAIQSKVDESGPFLLAFMVLLVTLFGLVYMIDMHALPAYRRLRTANYAYQDALDEQYSQAS